MRFRVELDAYSGPLDLLLYLVRRDELDVLEIPLALVAGQFLEILQAIESVDVEASGDFLDAATRLMEIKARRLLPEEVEQLPDEQVEESRRDLVQRLLEYRKYKAAAEQLEQRAAEWQRRFPRRSSEVDASPFDPGEQPIQSVELWDLARALSRVLREKSAKGAATRIRYDDTPLEVHIERLAERLAREPRLRFDDLFDEGMHRSYIVGVFLALLELVRHGRATVEQAQLFGEIWVIAAAKAEASLPAAA
jgi:segregation and condensation protein A